MAPLFKIVALLSLSLHVAAQGKQFITGACTSDADCASACCGFKSGKCAGPVVAQERDGGCGFGDPQPNNAAAVAVTGNANAGKANGNANAGAGAGAAAPSASAAAVATGNAAAGNAASGAGNATSGNAAGGNGAKAPGTQFITGACTSDADCASACCGFKSGKCAGPAVAQERDGGCGFGDAQPNANALKAIQARNILI